MDHNRLGGVMNHLNQQGISKHIYCVLCGRMTPDQKQIVRSRAKVDTQLFIDVMTWFIKESGHPGYKETLIPQDCTQPILIEDSETVNNTDRPVNASLETTYEGGTFFFSSAQEPSEGKSVYDSTDKFAFAIMKRCAPTLLASQTNMFLRNIQPSEYADVVTTLQSQVNAYLAEDDDGYLPANLCINGIATAIYMNASARVRDVGLASPRVWRVAGDWDSPTLPPVSDDELPLCGVQGYCPQVYRVEQGQDRFRRPYDRDGPAGRGGRGFDRDMAGRGRGDFARYGRRPSPRDRSIHPDLRRRPFLPGVQCAACKRLGHEASSCDMLAIALFLDKYKKTLPDDSRRTIESTWVARFKEKLGQPQRSPTQVMKAYCDDLDITSGHLDLAMDWDCWPEDDYGDFTQDLRITQD
jgi:hypothetical protein